MGLIADIGTPHRDGELVVIGVAAAQKIFGGSLVAVNAAGYATPAADSAGLVVVGVADEQVDNSAGIDGDDVIRVRRARVFRLRNSAVSPVGIPDRGAPVYVEDDGTVSAGGGTNSIVAGRCIDIDGAGVWVLPGPIAVSVAVPDSIAADVATMVIDFNGLLVALRTAGLMA